MLVNLTTEINTLSICISPSPYPISFLSFDLGMHTTETETKSKPQFLPPSLSKPTVNKNLETTASLQLCLYSSIQLLPSGDLLWQTFIRLTSSVSGNLARQLEVGFGHILFSSGQSHNLATKISPAMPSLYTGLTMVTMDTVAKSRAL